MNQRKKYNGLTPKQANALKLTAKAVDENKIDRRTLNSLRRWKWVTGKGKVTRTAAGNEALKTLRIVRR